jgi:hypothetical protein
MSDEASCAEGCTTDDLEALKAWRASIGVESGVFANAESAKKAKIFEVIRPNWRSKEVSYSEYRHVPVSLHAVLKLTDILHELSEIHESSEQKKKNSSGATRIRKDRTSNKPPMMMPYKFTVNQAWYDSHKDDPDLKFNLQDWNREDPPGWAEEWEKRIR